MPIDRSVAAAPYDGVVSPSPIPRALAGEWPERLAHAYVPVLRWFLAATACYYAIIAVSHVFDETGSTRAALVVLALSGCLAPLAAWLRLRRAPTPELAWLEAVAAVTYGLFFLNVATHQVLSFSPERLPYFVYMAMVFGVTAPTLRVAYGAIGVALIGMASFGLRMGPAFLDMYAFVALAGGFAAVGMATILRGVVTREICARMLSERLLVEAQSATRARSAFLALVSHEIRTPLNGVLGMAQAMRREPLPLKQAGRVETIQHEGEALSQILDDILDIVSLEANEVTLKPAAFDFTAFAQGLERQHAAFADAKGIHLAVDTADTGSGPCVADEGRLRQVAASLISNAIKFTPAGGAVRVSLEAGADELVICVQDTGVGIPVSAQARIFEPFALADQVITRNVGGAGLGLAICRKLVALMGGAIQLSSTEGAGSRFTVYAPIGRAAAEAAGPAPESSVSAGRALVVDDNATNRLVMRTLLEGLGLECHLVESGIEAVRACGSGGWDVVLMDIHMPQMDGMTATRAIRRREAMDERPPTPIIAVTASVMPEDIARYEAVGMDGVLAKPIALGALATVLQRVFAAQRDQEDAPDDGRVFSARA